LSVNEEIVVVVEAGSVRVHLPEKVRLLNVFAPVRVTTCDDPPESVRLLNVFPLPANVEAPFPESTMVDVPGTTVPAVN
jgi:hypothetical protein